MALQYQCYNIIVRIIQHKPLTIEKKNEMLNKINKHKDVRINDKNMKQNKIQKIDKNISPYLLIINEFSINIFYCEKKMDSTIVFDLGFVLFNVISFDHLSFTIFSIFEFFILKLTKASKDKNKCKTLTKYKY